MKKVSMVIIFMVASYSLFAQERQKVEDKIISITPKPTEKHKSVSTTSINSVQNKSVTISKKAGEPQRIHDASYYQEEIAKIEAHIQAIDTKIQYVQNDPAEHQLALQNNWYDDMNNIKNKLEAKKAEYQTKLNQLNQ